LLGRAEQSQYSEVFVGIDTLKKKHAFAIADAGRDGKTRYLGEIDSAPATVERVIKKLASKYEKVRVCYEAGPTGYGLYRQIITLGHECTVVAPSMIPKKPGDRITTNPRDAVTLARLARRCQRPINCRRTSKSLHAATDLMSVMPHSTAMLIG
jgi:transposase